MSEAAPENGQVEEAPAPVGLPGVAVYQGLPDVTMIVNEGNVVSPSGQDESFEGGQEITVSGPDAIALAAGGHATPVPTGAPAENGEPPAEAPVEEAPPA